MENDDKETGEARHFNAGKRRSFEFDARTRCRRLVDTDRCAGRRPCAEVFLEHGTICRRFQTLVAQPRILSISTAERRCIKFDWRKRFPGRVKRRDQRSASTHDNPARALIISIPRFCTTALLGAAKEHCCTSKWTCVDGISILEHIF